MKLLGLDLLTLAIPLVSPFETSFGSQSSRHVILIRAETSVGIGWGECVAMSSPVYSSEFNAAAELVIADHFAHPLFAAENLSGGTVGHVLEPFKGHRMAKAAVELAVLDAELRAAQMSLGTYLGATKDRVPAGVSVGIMPSIPELLAAVGGYLEQGYLRIKLKIKPGWDIEPVRAVREAFGDEVLLQVDANTAYSLRDAGHLARLDEFGLLLMEQPLQDEDLTEHAKLAARLTTPICLDESIESAKDASDAIALGATSVVNIKAGRVGGYLEARRVHDICRAAGVPVWCGGMLETGLGRAANVALAALPGFTLPGDTSASARFYHQDITAPFVLEDGHLRVPTGPGLGVEVDEDAVASFLVSRRRIDPTNAPGPVIA
ncbi:o-succinylbenzoate synthase [Nakamurella sp. A5-74]|uniref:o-succinylbenzoate synthase n=1 Tax=Nakamurella sp. A5-74 TaxID=3158264 RepID=A0AAU8DT38_9ACTN